MNPKKIPSRTTRAKKHTQVEKISTAGVTAYMSPASLHFYASDFLRVAKAAPAADAPFAPARLYLVCHTIELSIKAFLSIRGHSLEKLSRQAMGHNLENLFEEARKLGLEKIIHMEDHQIFEVNRASEYYGDKVFEYPALYEAIRAYPHLPNINVLLEVADALVTALEEPSLHAEEISASLAEEPTP
jgi:hypothetical protein